MKLTVAIILLGLVVGWSSGDQRTLGIPPWHPDWMRQFQDNLNRNLYAVHQQIQDSQRHINEWTMQSTGGHQQQWPSGGSQTYYSSTGSNAESKSTSFTRLQASNGALYNMVTEDRIVGDILYHTRKIYCVTNHTETMVQYKIDLANPLPSTISPEIIR